MSQRSRTRTMRRWRTYAARCDRLVAGQRPPRGHLAGIRVTPGFFRAQGWFPRNAARISRGVWPC